MPEVKMDFIPSDEEQEEEIIASDSEEDVDDPPSDIEEPIKAVITDVKHEKEDLDIDDIFVKNEIVKLTKKGVPRKKRPPMTEAHKEKLKAARVKAMASRQAKAKERKAVKELDLEEKELLKKQKIKKVKKLKEEVEEDDNVKPVEIIKEKVNSFTKADLEEAQLQAILNYEKIRKTRKKEKQVKMVKDKEEQDLRDKLTQAITPQKEFNPYAGCY
tara:strand:- start:429 stop:1076 length:648 start_codon:yes stop_codon:yes gene_type:complete